ncbi:hypothetical protein [Massilia sp. TWP1-3-3]|uniref:hypothetical protein n=1 Tax=Massilia sp. TWP1-3-3 TaxID=2804573 RepID=UPI003CF73729
MTLIGNIAARLIVGALALVTIPGCSGAETAPNLRQIECVGQYAIALPGAVEFALTKRESLLNRNGDLNVAFPDGFQPAHARFFLDRKIDISAPTSDSDFATLRSEVEEAALKRKKDFLKVGKKQISDAIEPFKVPGADSFAWRTAAGIEVYTYKGGHIYRFTAHADTQKKDEVIRAQAFLGNMKGRATFEIPSEKGVCFPHSFLRTEGHPTYEVGAAMRLVDYPEVEIFFEDSFRLEPGPGSTSRDSKSQVIFFVEAVLSNQYSEPAYHWYPASFMMGGNVGKAAFVNVRRGDNGNDFVFIAAATGATGQTVSSRDLLLYISRNSARAKGTPISEAKFRALAEAIAMSVKPIR